VGAPDGRGVVSEELVGQAQRGDHEAFEALVRPVYHRLYAVAYRVLRDGYGAEDAVQDAVVLAWRNLRSLRDPGRFEPWLQRLLVNACYDQLRRARRRPTEVALVSTDSAWEPTGASTVEHRDELERAFRGLSVEHRAVLVLTHYLGYSAAEVASIVGIPVGTVYSRIHNATAAVRRARVGPNGVLVPGAEQVR
jgi:RNA polymerase sigma-70 factor (ECF subfamily)